MGRNDDHAPISRLGHRRAGIVGHAGSHAILTDDLKTLTEWDSAGSAWLHAGKNVLFSKL